MSEKLVSRINKVLSSGGSRYRTFLKRMREISDFPPNSALLPTLKALLSLSHGIKFTKHLELLEILSQALRKRSIVTSQELFDTSLNLVFRLSQHHRKELDFYISEFVLNHFTFSSTSSSSDSQKYEKLSHQWSHKLLSKILRHDSMTYERLPKLVQMCFPKRTSTIKEHMDFTTNVLKICLSCQRIQKQILGALIDQLIQMDLMIKVQDFYQHQPLHNTTPRDPGTDDIESMTDEDNNQEDIEREVFHFNDLVVTPSSLDEHEDPFDMSNDDDTDLEQLLLHRNEKMILISEKVDYTMETLFEYINFCATKKRSLLNTLFEHLQEIFFSQILKTYQLNSTQFLMFYISSKRGEIVVRNSNRSMNLSRIAPPPPPPPQQQQQLRNSNSTNNNDNQVETFLYSQRFVQELLKWGILTENLHIEVKKCCIAYLGSFLARAKFIPPPFILNHLNELCDYCLRVLHLDHNNSRNFYNRDDHHHHFKKIKKKKSSGFNSNNNNNSNNHNLNSQFYCVTQCIFYVLCYRFSEELVHHKMFHQMKLIEKMEMIITSEFEPLRSLPLDIVGTIYHYFSSIKDQQILVRFDRITHHLRCVIDDGGGDDDDMTTNENFDDDDDEGNKNRMTEVVLPNPRSTTTIPVAKKKKKNKKIRNRKKDLILSSEYFPFDPYILRRSKRFIEPIFLEWSSPKSFRPNRNNYIDDDDDNAEGEEDEEDEEDDDDIFKEGYEDREIGVDEFLEEIERVRYIGDDDEEEEEVEEEEEEVEVKNEMLSSSPTLSDIMNDFEGDGAGMEEMGLMDQSIEDIFGIKI